MSDPNILILLWALPIALSLHVFEEFVWPGGFASWIRAQSARKARSGFYYFLVNAAGIAVAIIIALTASNIHGFRLYLYSTAFMGGNAVTHLRGTFRTKKYCPGTISSGFLLLPLCLVSQWYFVHAGNVDLFSALVAGCAGLFVGSFVVGVDVESTRRTRTVLLVGLPITVLLLIFLPAPSDSGRGRKIDVSDNFETATLSPLWETSRFAPGAVVMQTNISRNGRSAAKIVIRSRDKFEAGLNGDSDSERTELLEARSLTSRENRAYEYSFSMFIPTNFPIVTTRLIIAQWKQTCPDGAICSDDAPVLAIRYISGVLKITQDIGKGPRKNLYQSTNEFRGRWLDFRFQLRFATNETGRIQAWLGDDQMVDFTGVTANPEDATTGYVHPSRFFFKMGLYRNLMPEPMTIYIDEYWKKELSD